MIHDLMKYLLLLVALMVLAIIGAFLNGQMETPTERQDNAEAIIDYQATA